MEEAKIHKTKSSDGGDCQSTCLNMHRYCYSGCCVLRTILAVLLIITIFGIGYCMGFGEGREVESDRHGRYHEYMMQYGGNTDYQLDPSLPAHSSGIPVMRVIESTTIDGEFEVVPTLE